MSIATLDEYQVAQLLGWKPPTLRARYRALVEEHGFPLRLPGGRWFEPALAAWMARVSGMGDGSASLTISIDDPAPESQRAMVERYYADRSAA